MAKSYRLIWRYVLLYGRHIDTDNIDDVREYFRDLYDLLWTYMIYQGHGKYDKAFREGIIWRFV